MRPLASRCPRLVVALAFASVIAAGLAAQGPPRTPALNQPPEPLRFRYVGPPSAGRFSAIAGIPGNTLVYYAGAASGGVWKTTDGGQTFEPIFDDQPEALRHIGWMLDPSDLRG